jgi:subtilisin family serine protease
MTLAADWMLRVGRPDVLINAWSHDEGACTAFDLPFINAWRTAGIFVVFPAGNSGPGVQSGEAPAQISGTVPRHGPVFSVSGLDPSLRVHEGSSRGPSACGVHRFPVLSAPGAELPHAFPAAPDNYGIGEGTSLSAGLLGGAAALLLQARPELLPWELEEILMRTARDLPPNGWDAETGAGIPDLPAALAAVLSEGPSSKGERSP